MKKSKWFVFLIMLIGVFYYNVSAETYDGEYSLEYLLRNYNAVTLGQKDIDYVPDYRSHYNDKGSVTSGSMEGAVLVNGDLLSDYWDVGFNAGTTKSYVKGTISDHSNMEGSLVTDSNYIDFNKLYSSVLTDSVSLANNTQYHINGTKMEVTKPGIYAIDNIAVEKKVDGILSDNSILIKNYNKDDFYVFNMYDEYVTELPDIYILESNSPNSVLLEDFISNNNSYTGNIIFNLPNARSASFRYYGGHIVAPRADVLLYDEVYGTIIANSIVQYYQYEMMYNRNYNIDKKLINEDVSYVTEPIDFYNDYYSRDYSIKDLLQNYSLVTLGHKEIDSKSKLFGNVPGSVKMFHITGQALISGDLYSKVYHNQNDEFFSGYQKFDRTAFDLESNKVTELYVKGNVMLSTNSIAVIQDWDNMANDNIVYLGKKNKLFVGGSNPYFDHSSNSVGVGNYTRPFDNYLDFNRLYDNVVAEQSAISEGKSLKTGEDGTVHIKIGGNYTIEDISNVKEIVFDNFEDNKDKLTIITVKNSGDINFPLISKGTGGYKGIVTNDYYGKEQATHFYEQNTFTQDTYHGNIVWSLPNATYVTLKEGAPFAGHLIAPNADVETPETHFAGCFIVNSIYGEGNTEAHFYPITAEPKCDCDDYQNLSSVQKQQLIEYNLSNFLGGKASTVEKNVMGDEVQYRKDIDSFDHIMTQCSLQDDSNPIVNILKNPLTFRNLDGLIIVIGVVGFVTFVVRKKKKMN